MSGNAIPAEVLSELAHELKTPISVIAGYAELIASRSDEPATREAAIQIAAAAERLRTGVDRLLAKQQAE